MVALRLAAPRDASMTVSAQQQQQQHLALTTTTTKRTTAPRTTTLRQTPGRQAQRILKYYATNVKCHYFLAVQWSDMQPTSAHK